MKEEINTYESLRLKHKHLTFSQRIERHKPNKTRFLDSLPNYEIENNTKFRFYKLKSDIILTGLNEKNNILDTLREKEKASTQRGKFVPDNRVLTSKINTDNLKKRIYNNELTKSFKDQYISLANNIKNVSHTEFRNKPKISLINKTKALNSSLTSKNYFPANPSFNFTSGSIHSYTTSVGGSARERNVQEKKDQIIKMLVDQNKTKSNFNNKVSTLSTSTDESSHVLNKIFDRDDNSFAKNIVLKTSKHFNLTVRKKRTFLSATSEKFDDFYKPKEKNANILSMLTLRGKK